MTTPAPPVSVVIPVFNNALTLAATLASAAAQTHRALEIVIVDDGSSDASAEVAAAFCAREPRARLERQANHGVAAARNRAIALARGEWVAPLDADDIWHPEKLARQLAAAARAPAAGWVVCGSRDIDAADRVWRDGARTAPRGQVFLRLLAHNFIDNGSVLLFRREAALAVGGYDEDRRVQGCEDMIFQLRLAARFPLAVAPEYLVGYRKRAGSLSDNPRAMFAAWRVGLATLDLTGAVPQRVARRNLARRRLHLAEALVWRAHWGEAAVLAIRALAVDPLRGALTIADLVARRLTRPPHRAPLPDFAVLDPLEGAIPARSTAFGRLRDRLERARNARLARLES
ncbi:MAG: glycosyltransferase family 2 protein [Novosphingobium sp.]